MKKKKIVITSNTSWFIYNFHLTLLKSLQKNGYSIAVMAPRDDFSEKFEPMGMEYHEIKMNNKGTNPIEDVKLIFDFYKLYKKISPSAILQYTIKPNVYGSIAAGMLKIPVISSITGLGTVFIKESFSSKVAKLLYKIALRSVHRVFFLNADDRELFIQSNLVQHHKAELMPGSGIDTNQFKPVKQRSGQEGIFQFLFIARLLKDKGLIEYQKAAQILRDKYLSSGSVKDTQPIYDNLEFCILGAYYPGNPTAVTEEEIEAWEEMGDIKYLGTSDDVPSVISESDCVVLPSYREGLSQVLLEAASMAKPIVTTDVPGCKEIVEDGVNGYLCKVKDVNDLVEQMEKMLLLSHEQRIKMGQKGREKVILEFDEKSVNKQYMETIEELTS